MREGELQVIWQELQASARQLAWPDEAEDVVSNRLPGTLLKSTLNQLVRRHEALVQALTTSEEALGQRQQEVNRINRHIAALPASDLPTGLVAALSQARAQGDVAAQQKQLQTQLGRLQRDLDNARHALGPWCHAAEVLHQLHAPTQDEMTALIKRRHDLEAKEASAQQRCTELTADIDSLQLEIAQYQAAHQPVTLAQVQQLRTARDASWHAIKSGVVALPQAAPDYERQVLESDALSDQRHDRAQQATEFQLKLDRLARLQQQLLSLTGRLHDHTQAMAQFDQDWAQQIAAIGLTGLPLLKVNSWRAARDQALLAAAALAEAQSAQHSCLIRWQK